MTLSSAKETESGEDVTIANASRITTSTAQVMPQEQRLPAHMHNTTTAVPPSRNINKPSRKKRKATTVLAVGASRDKSRSVANSNSNEETSTTLQIVGVSNNGNSKSTHESGTHRNFDGTVSEMMHDEQSVANSESNETLKTQQQLVEQHSEPMESPLRSTNSHMPLELIPPIIPENTTGKPTLSTFCSTYPKPKQPRRTKQRSLATLIGASSGSTINDKTPQRQPILLITPTPTLTHLQQRQLQVQLKILVPTTIGTIGRFRYSSHNHSNMPDRSYKLLTVRLYCKKVV
jgi:hypothetical protein